MGSFLFCLICKKYYKNIIYTQGLEQKLGITIEKMHRHDKSLLLHIKLEKAATYCCVTQKNDTS